MSDFLSRADGRRIVEQVIAEFEEREGDPPGTFVVLDVQDAMDAWVVHWNAAEYARTREFTSRVMVPPIAVPKFRNPSEKFFVLGTSGTVEEELDKWRELQWKPMRPPVRFYRQDVNGAERALFRREIPDDPETDSVLEIDGHWHQARDLAVALWGVSPGYKVREISEAEAVRVITQVFGQTESVLHAPMLPENR
ncbi:hypothetical protein [Myceligenerans crystallogenes]|uniref:WYL domain-containing protein n=1 Tax=Myceligenerans crystallogenes TaxID=316335 RepID=A0ABN2NN53_9MICO